MRIRGVTLAALFVLALVVPTLSAAPPSLNVQHEHLSLPIAGAWVAADGTVFAGADRSLYRSADGRKWAKLYTFSGRGGLIPTVYVDSRGTVFASRKGDGRLLRSLDRGATWSTSLTFQSLACVAWRMAEDSRGRLYVGEYTNRETKRIAPRVYRSADGGATWAVLFTAAGSRHIHQVAVDPYHADRIYISAGDIEGGKSVRSDDDGKTWTALGSRTCFWQPTAMVFTSRYRILGMDNVAGGIYRTADDKKYALVHARPGSRNWLCGIDANGVLVFGSSPPSAGLAYIAASADEGKTWQTVYDFGSTPAWQGAGYMSNVAPNGWIYAGDGTLERAVRLRITRR